MVNQHELFSFPARQKQDGDAALHQYFTPEWAALELVAEYFPSLRSDDVVIEPSCGRGTFLKGIPEDVRAIGVEIDPIVAEQARANTGREIICGDYREVELPPASAVIGNPPFKMGMVDGFLDRSHELLPEGGRCAFILPAYAIQTPSRLLKWNEKWSVSQTLLPRTLFPRSRLPLLFVVFDKDHVGSRRLVGFTLYHEAHEIYGMPNWAKVLLVHGQPRKQTWRCVVEVALRKIGGRGTLADIYAVMQHRSARASENQWWKDKVRQILQLHFTRIGPATYAL